MNPHFLWRHQEGPVVPHAASDDTNKGYCLLVNRGSGREGWPHSFSDGTRVIILISYLSSLTLSLTTPLLLLVTWGLGRVGWPPHFLWRHQGGPSYYLIVTCCPSRSLWRHQEGHSYYLFILYATCCPSLTTPLLLLVTWGLGRVGWPPHCLWGPR